MCTVIISDCTVITRSCTVMHGRARSCHGKSSVPQFRPEFRRNCETRSSCNPSCDQLAPATATRDHLRTPGAYHSGLIPLLDKGSGTPIIVASFMQPAFSEWYW